MRRKKCSTKEEEALWRAKKKTKEEEASRQEINSDSYERVTLAFYIKMVKDVLALSPTLLGAPVKLLSAQSNTHANKMKENEEA